MFNFKCKCLNFYPISLKRRYECKRSTIIQFWVVRSRSNLKYVRLNACNEIHIESCHCFSSVELSLNHIFSSMIVGPVILPKFFRLLQSGSITHLNIIMYYAIQNLKKLWRQMIGLRINYIVFNSNVILFGVRINLLFLKCTWQTITM